MTHRPEKSDLFIVATKLANKPGQPGAESAERRERAEGNTEGQHTRRTQSRESVSQGLDRVREAAQQRKKERFTALLHYVTVDRLREAYSSLKREAYSSLKREAYSSLKREAAPGVDGATWQSYKQDLEINLTRLHEQVHQGTYRALPSRRRYIPKSDGRQRPLGIARWKTRSFNAS
jgi:RNA-directed DNA polymerase